MFINIKITHRQIRKLNDKKGVMELGSLASLKVMMISFLCILPKFSHAHPCVYVFFFLLLFSVAVGSTLNCFDT